MALVVAPFVALIVALGMALAKFRGLSFLPGPPISCWAGKRGCSQHLLWTPCFLQTGLGAPHAGGLDVHMREVSTYLMREVSTLVVREVPICLMQEVLMFSRAGSWTCSQA